MLRRCLLGAATLQHHIACSRLSHLTTDDLVLQRVVGDASWLYRARAVDMIVADSAVPLPLSLPLPPPQRKATSAKKRGAQRKAASRLARDLRVIRRSHRQDAWESAVAVVPVPGSDRAYFRAHHRRVRKHRLLWRALNAYDGYDEANDSAGEDDPEAKWWASEGRAHRGGGCGFYDGGFGGEEWAWECGYEYSDFGGDSDMPDDDMADA